MTRRVLPPVTVDTITYEADGSNGDAVIAWVEAGNRDELAGVGGENGHSIDFYLSRSGVLSAAPGDTIARHPDGTITVHSPAEVAAWGVTVEETKTRPIPDHRMCPHERCRRERDHIGIHSMEFSWPTEVVAHRFVTTFPDGSTHTTAWAAVNE